MQRNGYVYRKGSSWFVQFYQPVLENGIEIKKRVAKRLGAIEELRTKESRDLKVQEILSPINTQTKRPESTDKLVDFIEHKYLPYCRAKLAPATVRGYEQMWEYLKPHVGDIRLK